MSLMQPRKKRAEIGQPMNIAVVDSGANLVAHVRMDGAWIGSIDISIKKAFDISTKDLSQALAARPLVLRNPSNEGRVMIFAGGIPLKQHGQTVGVNRTCNLSSSKYFGIPRESSID